MKTSTEKPIHRALSPMILALSLVLLLGGGYAVWRYYDEPPVDRYAPLIAKMAAHQVVGGDQGRVDLSTTYPGLTVKDQAYIRWRDDGSFLAMFPTYNGQGSEMAGMLYTSRPLQENDTRSRGGVMDLSQRVIAIGTYGNLLLEKQINPNWYYVSYKLR
jgi:hypothetical protein